MGGARKFILVQLPERLDINDDKQRVGAAFCDSIGKPRTIAEITKERVRRVITNLAKQESGTLAAEAAQQKQDRGFRAFKLDRSSFRSWDTSVPSSANDLQERMFAHVEHIQEGRLDLDLLYEILLKTGFPLTTPVETLTLSGTKVYGVASGALMLCLERPLTMEVIRAIADKKPERVVCLDAGFAGNDQLKTNAVQIFKTKGVGSFKTV